jgi:hypothetical protein
MLWAKNISDVTFDALRYSCPHTGLKSAANTAISTLTKASRPKVWRESKKDMLGRGSLSQTHEDTWKPKDQISGPTINPDCLLRTGTVLKMTEKNLSSSGLPPGECLLLSTLIPTINPREEAAPLQPLSGANSQRGGVLQASNTSTRVEISP